MLANLKLSQKGLLLVGSLLALELIFVGSLAALLNKAEEAAIIESHSKEIVGKTNHILQLLYDGGNAAAEYQNDTGNNAEASKRFHIAVDKLPAELTALKLLVNDSPDYLRRVIRVEKSTLKSLKLVSRVMSLAEHGEIGPALIAAHQSSPTFNKLKQAAFDDLRALMREQESIIAASPAKQAQSRNGEKQLLFVGVGLNVLIAIVLALFLVRGITRRLDVMVANTALLAKNQELLPAMKGPHDEIAKLDHSFHEMAETLKQLEETKRHFIAMVSHDLRSPLTSLLMYLDILEMGKYGELTTNGKDRTLRARNGVSRLISLINDLLDFEKLQSGEFNLQLSSVCLEPVISRSIDAVNSFAEKRKINISTESVDFWAIADADRLTQVLVNLISNSIKFSPDGGNIIVSAIREGEFIKVTVKDEGRGIPAEMHGTIFERFKQVKASDATVQGGTGLGLAICKAIIECHGGKIGVESEVNQGASFWFTLQSGEALETPDIQPEICSIPTS